ncbi:MAG: TetR/AcrR family transcriptional regulator [Chloroflexota bacterium]
MPRTKKDFEDRRQQIIDGALIAFSRKGFEKATNKDIASASGIGSPGLIYHYFRDKWDLFQQVMAERAPIGELLSQRDHLMSLPPREALTLIATTMLKGVANPKIQDVIRVVLGEALRRPQIAQLAYKTVSSRMIHLLAAYFEHQIALGVLRDVNVPAATRCFLGPLAAYVITHNLLEFDDAADLTDEIMIETVVDLFLNGIQVDNL